MRCSDVHNRAGKRDGLFLALLARRRELQGLKAGLKVLIEINFFVLAEPHPPARNAGCDQLDGGGDRTCPFPELCAFRPNAQDSNARIVRTAPERFVVNRPDLFDPIAVVDDLRLSRN